MSSESVQPMISVIVPAYKSENTIKNCLVSIQQQTHRNLEIIIVLKDSGDKTEEIINSLNEPRITIIKQTENTGTGGARNLGIAHSHSDWIGFVEADDMISPDFYQKLISETVEDGIEIAVGEMKDNGRFVTKHNANQIYTTLFDKYSLIQNGATFDKIFSRSLIEAHHIKCSEKIRYEDNIFIFKAFYFAKKIKTVCGAVYEYAPSPWTAEYIKILQRSIPLEAQEVVTFIKQNKFSQSERTLAYKKMIQSFVGDFLWTDGIYNSLQHIMGHPLFLTKMYWGRIVHNKFNKLKRKLFRKDK